MFYYVGLTDDPQKRKKEVENPLEWGTKEFDSETAANSWKAKYQTQSGYVEDKPGSTGLFGYWYKVLSTPAKKKQSGCAKFALFAILAFIIFGVIGTFTGGRSSTNNQSTTASTTLEDDKFSAICYSEIFVKRQLVSPSSADFPHSRESVVNVINRNTFEVVSYVDSQNRLGVMIRTNYICAVKKLSSGDWHLEYLLIE